MRAITGILISFLIFSMCGCATERIQNPYVFYNDQSTYDVLCEEKGQPKNQKALYDVKVLRHYQTSVSIETKKGETNASKSSCLFERTETMASAPESTKVDRLYSVNCQIGDSEITDKNLQLVDLEPELYLFRRLDGKIWVLPSKLCKLSEQGK